MKRSRLKPGTKGLTRKSGLAPQSAKRRDSEAPARRDFVADVLSCRPICQVGIIDVCWHKPTEVNELMRRSAHRAGILEWWNVEVACRPCHAVVTDNPGRTGWAMRHGHQVSREATNEDYGDAAVVRGMGLHCSPECKEDHRLAAKEDTHYIAVHILREFDGVRIEYTDLVYPSRLVDHMKMERAEAGRIVAATETVVTVAGWRDELPPGVWPRMIDRIPQESRDVRL